MRESDNVVPQKLFSTVTGLPSLTSASADYAIAAMTDGLYQFDSTGGSTAWGAGGTGSGNLVSVGTATSGGVFSGTAVTTNTLELYAGSNITLSQNGASVVIIGPTPSAASVVVSAGGVSQTATAVVFGATANNNVNFTYDSANTRITGIAHIAMSGGTVSSNVSTLNFSNANGVSFGLSGGTGYNATLTASHNGLTTQSVQTQGIGSFGMSGRNGGSTLGNSALVTGGLAIAAGSNITLSQVTAAGGQATVTIIGASGGGGGGGNLTVTASGGSMSSGSLSFDNTNGVTFGISNSTNGATITASIPSYSLFFQDGGGITFGTYSTTGSSTTITATVAGGGGGGGGGGIAIADSVQTATTNTVVFANSNNVSFGMSGSTRMTASIPAYSIVFDTGASGNISFSTSTNGSTTTVYASGPAGGGGGGAFNISAGGSSSAATGLTFINSTNNIGWGYDKTNLTAYAFMKLSDSATTTNAWQLSLGTQNGVTFLLSTGTSLNATLNASVRTDWLSTQSNQALSGSNGSFTFQTATFGNLNGASFYTSNGSVVASYTVPSTAGLISAIGLTGGTTNTTVTGISLGNSNGLAWGINGATITASYTQNGQAVSAGTQASSTFQTLSFSNANGVSWSTAAGGLVASVNTSYRASNDAIGLNTAQTNVTWTVNSSGLSLNAGGYAGTGSGFTGGSISATITHNTVGYSLSLSHPAWLTTAALSQDSSKYAGTSTGFTGANISASLTHNTAGLAMSMSVAAPGAAAENNWFNLLGANTAGNTTASGSTIGLSGINLTLSGTNNSVINVSVPAYSLAFANGNGVSFGTAVAGSTTTVTASVAAGGASPTFYAYPHLPLPMASSSCNSGTTGATGGSSQTTISAYIGPMILQHNYSYLDFEYYISGGTAAGTGSWTAAHMFGIYTLNSNTLSLDRSYVFNALLSQNSVTAQSVYVYFGTNSTSNSTSWGGNSSANMTSIRQLVLNENGTSFSAGRYWIVHAFSQRTSGASVGGINSAYYLSQSQTTGGARLGAASTSPPYEQFLGIFTTTSNGTTTGYVVMPGSIHTSALSNTNGSASWRIPTPVFYSNHYA